MNGVDGVENVTPSTFKAVVTAAEAFSFAPFTAQDVLTCLQLTHLVYTPPQSQEQWNDYCKTHPEARDAEQLFVRASVRSQLVDGTVSTFTVASFPLSRERVSRIVSQDPSAITTVNAIPIVLPVRTDIAANLDISVVIDGSVELQVDGPGSVTFAGCQYSSLIPEWLNHHMFNVNAENEEVDTASSTDLEEMFRLARH